MHRCKIAFDIRASNDIEMKTEPMSNCYKDNGGCKVQQSSSKSAKFNTAYDVVTKSTTAAASSMLSPMSSASSPSSSNYSNPNSPVNGGVIKKQNDVKQHDSDCDFKVTSSGTDSAVHSYSASPTSSMGKSSCNSADEVDANNKMDHSQRPDNYPALTIRRPDRAGRTVLVESGTWSKLFRDCGRDERLRVMDELIRQLRNLKNTIQIRVELDEEPEVEEEDDDVDDDEDEESSTAKENDDEMEITTNSRRENGDIITVKREDVGEDAKLEMKSTNNDSVPSTPTGQEDLFTPTSRETNSSAKTQVSFCTDDFFEVNFVLSGFQLESSLSELQLNVLRNQYMLQQQRLLVAATGGFHTSPLAASPFSSLNAHPLMYFGYEQLLAASQANSFLAAAATGSTNGSHVRGLQSDGGLFTSDGPLNLTKQKFEFEK